MLRKLHAVLAAGIAVPMVVSSNAVANDETDLLTNPGFETSNPAFPSLPLGWTGFNVESDDYVDINDPGAFVRTGNKSIRLEPSSGTSDRFKGWSTNLFRPDGSDLYDPDYVYLGGDVTVSGYYLVPSGEVIQDTIVGVKLEFRREPPNFSIWSAFEFAFPENSTGGEWMPFSFTVTDEQILAVGDFPPEPTSVTVLPFRFFGGDFGPGTDPTGTVFVDDLCIVQDMGGDGCSDADLAEPFGALNFLDVSEFLNAFSMQSPEADLTDDGSWNFLDVSEFLSIYSDGCP